jgi:predicted dehydrogenase
LPNGLHYEWAIRSLRAGKHVLLEKPSVSNAIEAEKLFNFHQSLSPDSRPVLLEAFHYLFHPSWALFLSQLTPSAITSASTGLYAPRGLVGIKRDDIRFQYSLAGGALMDLGSYAVSTLRQIFQDEPAEILTAEARLVPADEKCDEAFKATWRFPNGGIGNVDVDLWQAGRFGLPAVNLPSVVVVQKAVVVTDEKVKLAEGERHEVARTATLWMFIFPSTYHKIGLVDQHTIVDRESKIVKKWLVKDTINAYSGADLEKQGLEGRVGEEHWSTYRYMLEEFVNMIKKREGSGVWVDGNNSISQMKVIDGAYVKAGLPIRPTSGYE